MLIYYRLSSEHAGVYRECPIGSPSVTVSDLKLILAKRCGVASEFKRKIDFRVFLVSGNSQVESASHGVTADVGGNDVESLVEAEGENQVVQGYSKVVLQRIIIRANHGGEVLQKKARTELTADEWTTSEDRKLKGRAKKVPVEWLCGLCHQIMKQPLLVKCVGNCGRSACRLCIEDALKSNHACPFCGSAFRQVIRNKRLEEILKAVSLDKFDITKSVTVPHPISTATASTTGSIKTDAERSTCAGTVVQSIETLLSRTVQESVCAVKSELSEAHLGAGLSGGGGCSLTSNVPKHFIYLLPPEHLRLMRHHDMMAVDASSDLASALLTDLPTIFPSVFPDDANSACKGVGISRELLLLPCCLSGGGTSFSVGGFVRVCAENRVGLTERVATDLLTQWQAVNPPSVSVHVGGSDAAGVPPGNVSPLYVFRVNWIEKYGHMPMLPSRKQPLCGLVGANRRAVGGAASLGLNGLCAGLVRRNFIQKHTVEVSVEGAKYEEVLSCVRDYVQFGSRSTEPRKHPLQNSAYTNFPSVTQNEAQVPPRGYVSGNTSSFESSEGSLSVASLLSLTSSQIKPLQVTTGSNPDFQGTTVFTAANGMRATAGPEPLGLSGGPPDPLNPFLGYVAVLPFLKKEQFLHVRMLQRKAVRRSGVKKDNAPSKCSRPTDKQPDASSSSSDGADSSSDSGGSTMSDGICPSRAETCSGSEPGDSNKTTAENVPVASQQAQSHTAENGDIRDHIRVRRSPRVPPLLKPTVPPPLTRRKPYPEEEKPGVKSVSALLKNVNAKNVKEERTE